GKRVAVGLRTIAAVVIPAGVGYLVLARPIVSVALEHGALRAGSASTTAGVLALLALGLPGFSLFLFVARAYQAMQDTRTLFFLYLWENGANIGLALALYPSLGVHGLALSYSLSYTVAAAAGVVQLQRRVGSVDMAGVVQTWVRIAFASAVMAGAVAALSALPTPAVVKAGAGVIAGVTVYLVVANRLRVRELSALLRTGRGLP
ncbi:MAG: lipid II flippase MurJ, partial [Acidimicrobiales bacterium]